MRFLSSRYPMFLLCVLLGSGSALAGFQDLLKSVEGLLPQNTQSPNHSSLSTIQIDAGLKEALSIGAERAVALLGKADGFLHDGHVRISLPSSLQTVATGLRAIGQGNYVDEFEKTLNRAAEEAIPETLNIIKDTVQAMSLDDARSILSGGDDAATQFLRKQAGDRLHQAAKPIVSRATEKTGVTSAYKNVMGQAQEGGSSFGMLGNLLGGQSMDLDEYVTTKALDGLFLKLAAEEKAIRENPIARSTELLKQVFAN